MPATNRSLFKRNPLLFPRDPVAQRIETESYSLGCDARNDGEPIDENPYANSGDCFDWIDWEKGWSDADRALDDDEGGD